MSEKLQSLREKQAKLSAQIAAEEANAKEALREQIGGILADAGYTLSDVFDLKAAARPRAKSTSVYQDPLNPENTWGGRGRSPDWLNAKIAAGAALDDFKIGA